MNLKSSLMAAAPLSVWLCLGALAQDFTNQPNLEFEILGTLGPGYLNSEARDVSEDGDIVVGRSYSSGFHGNKSGFRWDNGEMTDLGRIDGGQTSTAWGISPDGSVIVGIAGYQSDLVPAIWTSSGIQGFTDYSSSTANDVSRGGDVIVGSQKFMMTETDFRSEAFVMRPRPPDGYEITRLARQNDTPVRFFHSVANAVTPDGAVVVGNRYTDMLQSVAVYWRIEYPVDPVYFGFGYNTEALGVSQTGKVIVGKTDDVATAWFFEGWQLVRTATMPKAEYEYPSSVQDVSHNGAVLVGTITTSEIVNMVPMTTEDAVIWIVADEEGPNEEATIILDDLLADHPLIQLDGFHCVAAYAVSGDGSTVVGYGVNAEGNNEAFRLSGLEFPTETPPDDGTYYDDTGPFLSWLYSRYAPWYWCYLLNSWVYVPDDSMVDGYGWVYTLR